MGFDELVPKNEKKPLAKLFQRHNIAKNCLEYLYVPGAGAHETGQRICSPFFLFA